MKSFLIREVNMIPVCSIDEIKERMYKPDMFFHVIKYKANLDLDFYRDLMLKAEKVSPLKRKDNFDTYDSLSLQYQDELNKFYDGHDQIPAGTPSMVGQKLDGFVDRSTLNETGEIFKPWFDYLNEILPEFHFFRTRLLRNRPIHNSPMHVDENSCTRVHLPLITDKFCIMFFHNTPYHLPADGSIYFCNTGTIPHSFHNFSADTERTHVVTCIIDKKHRERML